MGNKILSTETHEKWLLEFQLRNVEHLMVFQSITTTCDYLLEKDIAPALGYGVEE
jgi:hypothetical protein